MSPKCKKPAKHKPTLEVLEPRLLLSADPFAALVPNDYTDTANVDFDSSALNHLDRSSPAEGTEFSPSGTIEELTPALVESELEAELFETSSKNLEIIIVDAIVNDHITLIESIVDRQADTTIVIEVINTDEDGVVQAGEGVLTVA